MGKNQKHNSAYNGAPTDKKETVYKNDTNDEYVYENGQYESAHGGNGYRYGTNRQVSGVHKTLNREAQREYQALENALEYGIAGKKNAACRPHGVGQLARIKIQILYRGLTNE